MTIFLLNNRQTQKLLETYKTKSEIDEALFLFKKIYSPAAYKILKFILHTNGVTQAKYSTIAEAVGISESYLHRKIKKEINQALGEEILDIKETQKLDHSKSKKVRGSFYKIIAPLNKIKYLIDRENKKYEAELLSVSSVDSSVNSSVESESEIPCPSKTEDQKSDSQGISFKKNLLEKSFNKLNINNLFVVKNFGKIKIKSEVKNYLNTFPLFRDFMSWSESKRYEIAKTIQLAIIKTETDIEEKKPQYMIKNAIARFMSEYAYKPKNEFLRLLYTFVFNSLKNDQEDESETSEDYPEEPVAEPGTWESVKPVFRRLQAEKKSDDRSLEEKKAEIERMLKQLQGEDQEIADKPKTLDEYRKENREKIQDLDDLDVF